MQTTLQEIYPSEQDLQEVLQNINEVKRTPILYFWVPWLAIMISLSPKSVVDQLTRIRSAASGILERTSQTQERSHRVSEDRADDKEERATESNDKSETSTVHLKAEIHTSRGDHEEERELLRDGVDALVLEGQETEGDYRISEVWFEQALSGMFYLLSPVYLSKKLLVDLAMLQEAEIYYTRESDADILRNAPISVRVISMSLYFLLLLGSVTVGLLTGNYLRGAMVLAASFFLPVFLIRYYNSSFNSTDGNRDRIMADKITEAAQKHETVLAIVGAHHSEGICNHISEELKVKFHPPSYGRASRDHLSEILLPLFKTFSLLLTLYLAIMWFSVNLYLFLS